MLEPDYFGGLRPDISDSYRDLEARGFERLTEVVIVDATLVRAKPKRLGEGLKSSGSRQKASILTWPDGLKVYVDRPRARPVRIWQGTWQMMRASERSARPPGLFVAFDGSDWLLSGAAYQELYTSIETGVWQDPFGGPQTWMEPT